MTGLNQRTGVDVPYDPVKRTTFTHNPPWVVSGVRVGTRVAGEDDPEERIDILLV